MVQLAILLMASAVMLVLARRANAEFQSEARLPMQWSLSGAVNWTAPRALALGFIPGLSILTLCTILTLATVGVLTPHPGQRNMAVPVFAMLAITAIAAQLLHIMLIRRTVGKRNRL